jgi:hypothetical protein
VTRLVLAFSIVFATVPAAYAQAQAAQDPVGLLLNRLERLLNNPASIDISPLFAPTVPRGRLQQLSGDLTMRGAIRTTVFERARGPLEGVPEGDGFTVVVEFFIESPGKARIVTTGLDLQRPAGGDLQSWRFVNAEGLTSVEGLYRLRLNTAEPLAAKDLEITAEDLSLTLQEGFVFRVESDDGVTGLVLVGRGEMRFSPSPVTERGQVRLFAGSDTLISQYEVAFVRFSPTHYEQRVSTGRLSPAAAPDRITRRAQEAFVESSPLSFSVDLQDMSRDTWHLLPPGDDFLAEVDTRRFDRLTYSRSGVQAEDVTVFRREDRRTIALYPSVAKLAARGRFYSDDASREYDVLDYSIEAALDPVRQLIQSRARLTIRVRSTSVSTLLLRLAEPLTVTGITSVEYGRLLHLRLRSQNTILVNMPRTMPQDSDLTLIVTYSGRLPAQDLDMDTFQIAPDAKPSTQPGEVERSYLLSNRAYWYPQNPIPDYATASLRITVPEGFRAVASGEAVPENSLISLRDVVTLPKGTSYSFRVQEPVRYLAVVVSRLTRVAETTIEFPADASSAPIDPVAITIIANPRLQGRGRALLKSTEDVIRFYASLVEDAPYGSFTLALVESVLPGGHSPGYFAVLNEPLPNEPVTWRADPAAFTGFPDFFLAHELAHQWWGQAVGSKNYHEQWLSEGFAQYFAALYAQKTRGERVFTDMLRQFRRWALSESDQGPVYLGYRLGLIRNDLRVFRAIVYNKGAAVLHMLRRLLGDKVFFDGVRRFYLDRRHEKAGTDDFERAMETASGRVLDRFFERWIYGSDLPQLTYSSSIGENEVTVRFEQQTDAIFDLPVTVTLVYANGQTTDVVVAITEKLVERKIRTEGPVRQVQINRDSAAVAEFDEER